MEKKTKSPLIALIRKAELHRRAFNHCRRVSWHLLQKPERVFATPVIKLERPPDKGASPNRDVNLLYLSGATHQLVIVFLEVFQYIPVLPELMFTFIKTIDQIKFHLIKFSSSVC